MTANDLLSQLRQKGVEVKTAGDGRLVIDAPRGTVNDELRAALAGHKAELIQILMAESAANVSETPLAEVPQPLPARPQALETVAVAPTAPQVGDREPSTPQAEETAFTATTAGEISRLEAELMRLRTEEEARRAEVEAARLAMENTLRIEQERWRKAEEETARKRAEKEKQRIEVEAREQAAEEHRRQIAEQELTRAEGELKRMRAMEDGRRAEVDAQFRAAREAHEAELAALHQTERDQAGRRAEEERRYLESENRKRVQEDELRRSSEMRFRNVAEEIERIKARDDARRKAAEDAERLAEEAARRRTEEAARRQAEAEARTRAEEEARLRAEIEAQMRAEAEQRRRAEEETLRLAEEEARRRAEEEAQRLAAEQARRQAEAEAQRRAEEAARQQAEEAARLVAEQEARRRAEAEAVRQAEEEVRLRAEAEVRQRAELEARIRAEVDAKIQAEEAERRQAEEARRHAEHERIVAEETARTSMPPEMVFEAEPGEVEFDFSAPAPAIEGRHEETKVTEIAEWFEVDIEKRAQPQVADAPAPRPQADDHFGALQDDAGGEFTAVSVPENNLMADATGALSGIMNQLNSEKPAERTAAVGNLPRVGGEEAFLQICAAFDDRSVEVRNAAARAMFDFQEDRATAFTRALREANPDRRRRIGSAIASSGLANEAIRNLTGESREKTYDAFSLLFLMSKAGETQVLMRSIEEHANLEVRLAVVKLLALSGQPDILPAFRRMAVRGSLPPEVRSEVMEAIYQITSQSPVEAQSMQ